VRNKRFGTSQDRQFMAAGKALAAFPDEEIDLAAYQRLFDAARGSITGDISPMYATLTEEQLKPLAHFLRGRSLLMIARDPIERFWSGMAMYWRYGALGKGDYGSLEKAQRLFNDPIRSRHHFPTRIIDRWDSAVGEGALRPFIFDDIVKRPRHTLNAIVAYVGGNPRSRLAVVPAGFNRKANLDRPAISAESRAWVVNAFAEELDRCAERFGETGRKWRDRHRAHG